MRALNPAFWCNHYVDGANEHLKFLNVFAIKIVIFCAAFRDNANAPLHAYFLVFGSPIYTLRSGEVDIKEWKCHGTALVWQTTRLSEEATAVMNSVSFFLFSIVFVILSLNPVSCQYGYNMGQSQSAMQQNGQGVTVIKETVQSVFTQPTMTQPVNSQPIFTQPSMTLPGNSQMSYSNIGTGFGRRKRSV